MPWEKENTQHIALKFAPLLFNGDSKLFSGYALSLITWFVWFIWFWKRPVGVGEQLCDANVFYLVAPDDHISTTPDHLYPSLLEESGSCQNSFSS